MFSLSSSPTPKSLPTIHTSFSAHPNRLRLFRGLSTLRPPSGGDDDNFVPLAAKSDTHLPRRLQPDRHALKAKDYIKEKLVSSTDASTPLLDPCSPGRSSHAIGMVAAAQANFMRVLVERVGVGVAAADSSRSAGKLSSLPESDEIGGFLDPTEFSSKIEDGDHPEGSSPGKIGEEKVGIELLCVVRAVLKKIKRRVLVGDKVLVGSIDWVDRRGMIENVFERKSVIIDPPVSNVDHLLVLFSMEQPKLEPFALTRFLVEAESTGIPVTLALNKLELVDEEVISSWKRRLRSWGYEPIFCSVNTNHGLASLAFILKEQTTVIVGPSGVGKSSLINALRSTGHISDPLGDQNAISKWFEDQRVGEVSTRSGRGKHTTRHVSLLPLAGGGYLADTPGFNQPSLLKVTARSLAEMFPEVRQMLRSSEPEKCSFSDCLHIGEPGCIVKGDWERYPYYLQLLDEIKVREEFQLRTLGTKREGDVRYKMGGMGVKQAEPRLELKKHRRQSRKRLNQSLLDDLDDLDDDEGLVGLGGTR
ncbi:putative ribosome biogenesis GTPase [Nymphaea thermarum]|nr:putative ribosome biogenesis GTPase [Nymphaea thermarum]